MKHIIVVFVVFALLCAGCSEQDNAYRLRLERILHMENIEAEAAIPSLQETLATSDNIREYAAAQALFCMGTKEAHQILREYVLASDYDILASMGYAFHWDMEESKRDIFLRQYHLRSSSEDISLSLAVAPVPGRTNTVAFHITLTNTAERPLRLAYPLKHFGACVLLLSPTGHFMRQFTTGACEQNLRPPEQLSPGQSFTFSFKGEVKFQRTSVPREELANALVLDCGNLAHRLEGTGKYQAYAVYCFQKPRNNSLFDKAWEGRAVSEPVQVHLKYEPSRTKPST